METLFGIPLTSLLVVLLVLFAAIVLAMGFFAWRNPVTVKLGLRNIPRRRAQTGLVVFGLMLASLLFSASFATGDTMTHSIRLNAVSTLGPVDEVVRAENPDATGRYPYFSADQVAQVNQVLASDANVAASAGVAREQAPVAAPAAGTHEASVDVLGYPATGADKFSSMTAEDGTQLNPASLGPGAAFLSRTLADDLGVNTGDTIQVFLGATPASATVAGIYTKGAYPSGDQSIVMPLSELQALTGHDGQVNEILVANRGSTETSAPHSDEVVSRLEPVLQGTGLEATPVKQDALDEADRQGSSLATVFLLFGQFSIAAGVLLIFLIFVMLAAERKQEMGMARAVGMQRGHLIRMFAFEGAAYSLISAAIGSLLGIGVGVGMARIMAITFGTLDFKLAYAFNWRSVAIAFLLGVVLTFAVVLVSSWRVSRLNIVRAVRDLPEPRADAQSRRNVVIAAVIIAAGAFLTFAGLTGKQVSSFSLGTSLIIIGVPLLLRRVGLPERAAYSIAGIGLVVWWLVAFKVIGRFLPEMSQGIEMFFLSGIMLVLGGVWAVMYNSDLLIGGVVALFGRVRGLPPVLRTAIAYPLNFRFRTGMTVAMISLVVFTLVVMAFIIHDLNTAFSNPDRISGGFQIIASTGYANPVSDMSTALEQPGDPQPSAFTGTGAITNVPVQARQAGSTADLEDITLQGVDNGYAKNTQYGFALMAPGFSTPAQVWAALESEPDTAVVASWMVPARANYSVGAAAPPFSLEGFYIEDSVLPNVSVQVQDPRSGNVRDLKVIGVLSQTAVLANSVITSQQTVNGLVGMQVPPQAFVFRLAPGEDAGTVAKALEQKFFANGMQATVFADELKKQTDANLMINNLLQGFMGLGLVVGIAALGVIAARSVVERRHQIGVLRALGFQKRMVQASFLMESSFIAILGIGLGLALGFGLTPQIISEIANQIEGVRFEVPWVNILIVTVLAYLAALLTTYVPARQTARIEPAEALRFE